VLSPYLRTCSSIIPLTWRIDFHEIGYVRQTTADHLIVSLFNFLEDNTWLMPELLRLERYCTTSWRIQKFDVDRYRMSGKSLCTCYSSLFTAGLVEGRGELVGVARDISHVRHLRLVYETSWITFHFQHSIGIGSLHFLQVHRRFLVTR
jgi:hypothetical protein